MKAKGSEGESSSMASMTPMILGLGVLWQGLVRGLHVPGKGQEGQQVGKQDQVAVVTRSAQHTVPVYATEQKNLRSILPGVLNLVACCGCRAFASRPRLLMPGRVHNYRTRYSVTVL